MASLMERMLKTAKKHSPLAEELGLTKILDKEVITSTGIPLLNIANSGRVDGGIIPGAKQLVGDSRTFKTMFGLVDVKAYLDKFPDAICIFLDSEFGANQKYWVAMGIDMSRVVHVPLTSVENMQIVVMQQLNELERGDHVIFFIDSISQLPSSKEVNDAIKGEDKQDMTRARALNSFWRTVTIQLNLKNLPMVWINSYYDEIGNQYAEPNLKGGKQGFLSADNIWFITRSQVKKDADLMGWNFNIKIMKGRFVKEQSKFPVTVLYEGGIDKWSGLLEISRALGYVDMPSSGWYQRSKKGGFGPDEKKYQKTQMGEDFWLPLLENPDFCDDIAAMYGVSTGTVMKPGEQDLVDNAQKDS
ncbi:DNA repair protein [Erwinia phage vB_EamM-Bue1]|uniref:Recombination protein n=1 Tax=Erwinia phage vB_EamM-Bue1 TaxID=2099338 RepID=A0A2P1JU53_9CAUD|nr:DNA repair protein [Erwinia phage vB_EamM-Bue1]AVO22884.1 recombination protein [Erwinia phage vB_EamM-Bue1]